MVQSGNIIKMISTNLHLSDKKGNDLHISLLLQVKEICMDLAVLINQKHFQKKLIMLETITNSYWGSILWFIILSCLWNYKSIILFHFL